MPPIWPEDWGPILVPQVPLAASVRRGLVAESASVTDALVMAALLVGLDWTIRALSLRL